MSKLCLPEMLFKIKVIKTYISYVPLLFYILCAHKHNKKMASSQKTSLFEAKLYYNDFMRLFVLRKTRNLEARRINCTAKKQRQQISNFPSDFYYSKNIFTFILDIPWSEWLLTFMLNVKRYRKKHYHPWIC